MVKKINWEEIPIQEVAPSMHRKIVTGEKIMIARMKFKDGFVVPKHSHHNEQITQVISGTIRFWLGDDLSQIIDLGPGDVLVIPAFHPHKAEMIGQVEAMDTWSPPRQDWIDGTDRYLRSKQ